MVDRSKGRRLADLARDRLLVISLAVNLIAVLVLGAGSVGLVRNSLGIDDATAALEALEQETQERIHQDCLRDERDHLEDVRQLGRTYDFLLTFTDRSDPLYIFAVRSLPLAESEARNDLAPPYCDKPRVGLPEPDPVVPDRPAKLRTDG